MIENPENLAFVGKRLDVPLYKYPSQYFPMLYLNQHLHHCNMIDLVNHAQVHWEQTQILRHRLDRRRQPKPWPSTILNRMNEITALYEEAGETALVIGSHLERCLLVDLYTPTLSVLARHVLETGQRYPIRKFLASHP